MRLNSLEVFFTADGKITFGAAALQEVPTAGGAISHLDITSPARFAFFPSPLPDGRHFVFLGIDPPARAEGDAIFLGTLDVKPDAKPGASRAKKLLAVGRPTTGPHEVVYAPSPNDPNRGYILADTSSMCGKPGTTTQGR
jgi:hypothetical protein